MIQSPGSSAALSPERRALLEAMLQEEGLAAAAAARIPRRARQEHTAGAPGDTPGIRTAGDRAPLSFAQQRLWFLDQFHPNSSQYNIPIALRLAGRLDHAALEAALNEIIRRHESLRTRFPVLDGEPVQWIAPSLVVPIRTVDLTTLPEGEREREAERQVGEEAVRPFDLASGPLLRPLLLRLAPEEHLLLLTMHHIVSDGWSRGVLVRELGTLYDAFCRGEGSPLPELPIQYADYAVWQRLRLQGETLDQQLSYWKRQLADAPAVLELPADHPRPAVQSFLGGRESLQLSRPLTEALHALSQREGATLFMVLMAAFQTLLHRYTGQQDLLVGTPIANRTREELEGLIGFFVNTLVLRTDLSGDPSFRALIGRVREAALGAYAHQDLPFEKLVEELQPERSLSHAPLFQVFFALQNTPQRPLRLSGLEISPQRVERETAKSDLGLYIVENVSGLAAAIEYNSDLFEASTIRRLLSHFQTLLEGVAADPDRRLSALPLLPDGERRQLLREWNDTRADYRHALGVHQLFEAQARRTPAAVAVIAGDQSLTYEELNRSANRLARRLCERGVGPEVRVALCLERSPRLLVALLAILKAGGAYVPLDPAYPTDRLAHILIDSQATLLLTETALLPLLPAGAPPAVCLDEASDRIEAGLDENLERAVQPEQLAYVLYTSGSTGRPKGVAVPQRAVVNFLDSMCRRPGLCEQDVLAAVTTIAFDIAALELFLPLTVGARVVLASREVAADGEALWQLLERSGATVMQATPATWQMLLAAGWQPRAGLKILCGGELLQTALAARLREHGASLWNLYGPTETTIWSAVHPVEQAADEHGTVSIGGPIANTQIYLLDSWLEPAPVGVAGELYIGGAGLARGYLGRAELTAERFVPHPFSDEPGARLYRTGDLARWRAGGTIEFLGRRDHQVKLRGFRIELGEIESVLLQHTDVREGVVMVREAPGGEQRLAAYFVAREGSAPGVPELRAFLQAKLPDYMVPSTFVQLDALPLTANGKVDRRALPAPEPVRPELERSYLAPRDALEIRLATIWEKLLGVRPVGVTDDFFELGGHSLLAVRLFAEIEKACGKKLPLALLFQAPTIAQIAGVIRQEGWEAPWRSLVAIQPAGSRPPFFCVHGAGGHVLAYRHLAQYLGQDQPVYGIQARGLDGALAVPMTVEQLAAHYIREIRSLQPEGPYHLGGFSFGGYVAYEMSQQLHADGQEVALLALMDIHGPATAQKDWSRRKKLRAHLYTFSRLGPAEKMEYLGARAKAIREEFQESAWRRLYQLFRKRGWPLPRPLRDVQMYHRQALSEYRLHPYPGRITVFRAAERGIRRSTDPQMGWGRLAQGGVEILEVPGDHATMVKEPHVRALAERLSGCLTRGDAPGLARED